MQANVRNLGEGDICRTATRHTRRKANCLLGAQIPTGRSVGCGPCRRIGRRSPRSRRRWAPNVLALATFVAVRAANRAARVAEYSMQIGIRPMLMPSRLKDTVQRIMWGDEHWARLSRAGAVAEIADDNLYLAMSVRNAPVQRPRGRPARDRTFRAGPAERCAVAVLGGPALEPRPSGSPLTFGPSEEPLTAPTEQTLPQGWASVSPESLVLAAALRGDPVDVVL